MFVSPKSKLALATVAVAGVAALPSAANAATPIPALQAGDIPACIAQFPGGPCAAVTRNFTGSLTLTDAGGFQITCSTSRLRFNVATTGLATVPAATFNPPTGVCTTSVPGCTVTVAAANLPWGVRLVRDAASVYRARISVQLANTFTAGCPRPAGTDTYFGVISPALTSGTPGSVLFNASAGTLASPLGPATVNGTVAGPVGAEPSYFRDV
jgi:hypothetical protein